MTARRGARHGFTAQLHQPQRIGEAERRAGNRRCKGAHRKARDRVHRTPFGQQRARADAEGAPPPVNVEARPPFETPDDLMAYLAELD